MEDRYAIERELGRGGMATVYLARDLRHGRLVALKVLRPELAAVVGRERFAREIAIAARLSHPHILPLHDSGTLTFDHEPVLFYTMPYVAGRSLRERLREEAQLPLDEVLRITRQVADGLDHAHRHGIVHRDVKPENILLAEGEAVVADFGIARALDAAAGERLTETGLALGTPAYMSPEQGAGSPQLDSRTDTYSLGVVVYEMLAGQPPFTGPSAQAILARHAVDPVPALRTVRSTVPPALEQVVTRALAKVPADRFSSTGAFAQAVERAISAPATPTIPVAKPKRASRRTALLAAIAVVTAAVGTATAALRHRPSPPRYTADRVAVAPIENQTGDPVVTSFTRELLTTMPDAIAREGVGDPVPAATVRDLLAGANGSPGQVADHLARETGAGLQLRGVCTHASGGSTTCQVDVLRMPAKALRMSVSVTGNPSQPDMGAKLTERVLVALLLQRMYGDQVTWQGEYIPRSLAAVRAMGLGSATSAAEAARLDTAWAGAAALATDTNQNTEEADSTLARLLRRPGLLGGERETIECLLAWRRGDPAQVFTLSQRRFAVNPVWWRNRLMAYALMNSRPHAALAASVEPDPASAPAGTGPDAQTYHTRGYALHQLGRYREELELARFMERRFPDAVERYRTHEAMALAALGMVDSLRRRLAEWEGTPAENRGWSATRATVAAAELVAHGHVQEGHEVLASTLPFYRRLQETERPDPDAVRVFERTGHFEEARQLALAGLRATRSVVDSVEYLGGLGAIAADQGRRAEATRYDRLLAAVYRIRDPNFLGFIEVQRAGIASRLGDREGAVWLLEKAWRNGAPDAGHYNAHRAFPSLLDYPPFQRFLQPRD